MRTFLFPECVTIGGAVPWLAVLNHSGAVMTAEIKLKLDKGGPVITFHKNVPPYERLTQSLKDAVGDSNFWLSVKIDVNGAAALSIWKPDYAFPPLMPVPTVL